MPMDRDARLATTARRVSASPGVAVVTGFVTRAACDTRCRLAHLVLATQLAFERRVGLVFAAILGIAAVLGAGVAVVALGRARTFGALLVGTDVTGRAFVIVVARRLVRQVDARAKQLLVTAVVGARIVVVARLGFATTCASVAHVIGRAMLTVFAFAG